MSTPAAKRRRIDIASHTLSKPFRSPFKTPLKSPLNAQNESQTDSIAPAPPMNSLSSASSESTHLPHVSIPSTISKISVHISPRRPHKSPSPRSTALLNSDPDIAPLLRAQREFERQLREVKEQLETAEQARKIETESGKKDPVGEIDVDLLELITKWKIASRQAAEELFGQVRDRVNRFQLSLLPSDWVWLTGPSEWGVLEPGRRCKKGSRSFRIRGIRKSLQMPTRTMPMLPRTLRREFCILSTTSMWRLRTRNRSISHSPRIWESSLDKRMCVWPFWLEKN